MVEHAADEVIGQRRESQAAAVRWVEKQIAAGGRIGQVVVHVGARARAAREWLGHERRDRSRPLCELASHHPEERHSIGGHKRVGISKVDLILEIGVFMVGLVDAPAEPAQAVVELAQETESARNALEVVARLGEVVDSVRVPATDRAVGVFDHQEKLGLDAHVEEITLPPGPGEHALEIDARTVRMRLAVDV